MREIFRRTKAVRRAEDTERIYPLPGTEMTVTWDQSFGAYVVRGPGAPEKCGRLESIEALAQALDPVPLPEQLRTVLAADRSARPPYVDDEWQHFFNRVEALVEPLGDAVTQVVPYIPKPQLQAVEVSTDPDLTEAGPRVVQIMKDAGYGVQLASTAPNAYPGIYLVWRPRPTPGRPAQ